MNKLIFSIVALLCFVVVANSRLQQDDGEKYYQLNEVDQKIQVTFKPRPPASKNCTDDSGMVALRVYFHKSEKISRAQIVRPSSCGDFDQNAIYAAKQIKFKAAVKGGQAVSAVTIVEYRWQKY